MALPLTVHRCCRIPSRRRRSRRGRLALIAVAVVLALASGGSSRAEPPAAVQAMTASERAEVARLYASGAAPLWLDDAGALTPDAVAALALLARAPEDGLEAADYRVGPPSAAGFDAALSAAVLRYLRHLHLGRIDPHRVGVGLTVEHAQHDFVRILRDALAAHDLPARAAALTPPFAQYVLLRRELAVYRGLVDEPGPWPPARPALRPGDRHPGLATVRRRLQRLGDLPAATPADGDDAIYDPVLDAGVRRFQARHGLTEDAVLGATTLAALTTPVARRIDQITFALERLRWLPDASGERVVVLNIPMFRLWTWGGAAGDPPGPRMRVIVGRAVKTETPVFVAEMREVVFQPYWNVPASILRHELLPAIARDPRLLARRDFEAVRDGPGGGAVVPAGAAALAGLRDGSLRLRQRPGPGNALGLVKFVFPNDASVYLHGTPEPQLFGHPRRDFSHGCIRVESPAVLAEWVLAAEPGWSPARIAQAMADGPPSQTVPLSRPIRVVLFYTTAAVTPEDGAIHFADDIYRHDARLADALRERRGRAEDGDTAPTASARDRAPRWR